MALVPGSPIRAKVDLSQEAKAMAYHDMNSEGLTFSEWIQAAGYFKPDPMTGPTGGEEKRDCAPYTRTYKGCSTQTFFPKKLRDAWRNGEDPSEYR
jgi:hypothetical protein